MDIQIYSDKAGRVPFVQWLEALTDRQGRAAIKARLLRLEAGNFGDCKPLRDGVQELRIDKGPGYRVYLSRQGPVLVLLLCGSDKADQDRAIKQAIDYLNDWKERGCSLRSSDPAARFVPGGRGATTVCSQRACAR